MFGKDHDRTITDGIGVDDPADTNPDPNTDHGEVKGPDEDHWGPDHERPTPAAVPVPVIDGVNVKGPDPAVWGN